MKTTNRKNTTLALALGLALLGGAVGLTSAASGSGAATSAAAHAVAQAALYVYTFVLTYYDGSTVVHQEPAWETVAHDPAEANAYASNHLAVVTQQLEAQGRRVSRSSGVIVNRRPLNPGPPDGGTAMRDAEVTSLGRSGP